MYSLSISDNSRPLYCWMVVYMLRPLSPPKSTVHAYMVLNDLDTNSLLTGMPVCCCMHLVILGAVTCRKYLVMSDTI